MRPFALKVSTWPSRSSADVRMAVREALKAEAACLTDLSDVPGLAKLQGNVIDKKTYVAMPMM